MKKPTPPETKLNKEEQQKGCRRKSRKQQNGSENLSN
jgi:hypothetical protein